MVLAVATLTDQRTHASNQAPADGRAWHGQFVSNHEGATEIRPVTIRPETGVDIRASVSRGGLRLGDSSECTALEKDGYRKIGVVDGLGSDRWQRCSPTNAPG